MLIALDDKGNRIKAFKGGRGKCQICNNDVRAYCGDINIHHWRHIDLTKCDFWKENETEWHRKWKKKFPIEWQEVVVRNKKEIHRADIKTPSGLVVEFQNSSISSSEVRKREQFYDNMIWLINAEEFKANFNIWSEVKAQLRYLEQTNPSFYYDYYNSKDSQEIKLLKESISKTKRDIKSNKNAISKVQETIKELKELEGDIKQTTNKFLKEYFEYSSPMKKFESDVKESYMKVLDLLKELSESFIYRKEKLEKIETFEKCKMDGFKNFSIVEYKDISSKHYRFCKMIKKETMNSLFPDIIDLTSTQDFERMARNQNFFLLIDFRTIVTKLESESLKLKEDIFRVKNTKKNQEKSLKNQIKKFLKTKKKKAMNIFFELKEKNFDLKNRLYHQKEELKEIKKQETIEEIASNIREAVEEENRKYSIIKNYKSLYGYRWKYRRKTWDCSEKPIYLDFGNTIFHIQDNSRLKKITHQFFIDLVMAGWS